MRLLRNSRSEAPLGLKGKLESAICISEPHDLKEAVFSFKNLYGKTKLQVLAIMWRT